MTTDQMTITQIPVAHLSVSELNVRSHRKTNGLEDILPSVKRHGVRSPLMVRQTAANKYEIIAGKRRYEAAKQANLTELPCIITAETDPGILIQHSLIENTARKQMTAMDEYLAYRAMVKAGMDVPTIAADFDVDPRTVEQRLAIANLLPGIIKLYEQDELNDFQLQTMTLANHTQQRKYCKLDPRQRPAHWELRRWILNTGADIPPGNELFNTESTKLAVVIDLFGDAPLYADGEQYWKHQMLAVDNLVKELETDGWPVLLYDFRERGFIEKFNHDGSLLRCSKTDGGSAVVTILANGQVLVHKGYALPKAKAKAKAKADSQAEAPTPARPEVSAKLCALIDRIRLLDFKSLLNLDTNQRYALAHLTTRLLCNYTNVTVSVSYPTLDDELQPMIDQLAITKDLETTRHGLMKKIDLIDDTMDAPDCITNHLRDVSFDTMFAAINLLSFDELIELLAFISVDTIINSGKHSITSDIPVGWKVTPEFLKAIANKETLTAIAKDFGIEVTSTMTMPQIRGIIYDKLAANKGLESWLPKWFYGESYF